MQKFELPTGYLFTDDYEKGPLETLSIGDYGKARNVKADFLGLTREIEGVANGPCMPLSEKWVITLSTQHGCPMKCTFCDVPQLGMKGNVSQSDLYKQFWSARKLFPNVKYVERLNIHFARMGEPIFNEAVFDFAESLYTHKHDIGEHADLRIEVIHPVMTTSLPVNYNKLKERILRWCDIKNDVYNGQAGFQFSINSTDEAQRTAMFSGQQLHLKDFSHIAEEMPDPTGRKYCLNFAYADGFEIDGKKLAAMFDPDKFMCKITPIHQNKACADNKIQTLGGYESYQPYKRPEESLKAEGFDVLVFVPSMDEEDGLVTCGNAVLSGREVQTGKLNIEGENK